MTQVASRPSNKSLTVKERAVILSSATKQFKEVFNEMRELINNESENIIESRFSQGEHFNELADPKNKTTYGNKSISNIARLLDVDRTYVSQCKTFATICDKTEAADLAHARNKNGNALTWSHVVILIRIKDKTKRESFLDKILDDNLNFKETEALFEEMYGEDQERNSAGGRKHKRPSSLKDMLASVKDSTGRLFRQASDVWASNPKNEDEGKSLFTFLQGVKEEDLKDPETVRLVKEAYDQCESLMTVLSPIARELDNVLQSAEIEIDVPSAESELEEEMENSSANPELPLQSKRVSPLSPRLVASSRSNESEESDGFEEEGDETTENLTSASNRESLQEEKEQRVSKKKSVATVSKIGATGKSATVTNNKAQSVRASAQNDVFGDEEADGADEDTETGAFIDADEDDTPTPPARKKIGRQLATSGKRGR